MTRGGGVSNDIFIFYYKPVQIAIIISISESIVTVKTKDEIAEMLANYWSFIVDYEAQLKHYTTELTLLPFNDGVVAEDVSTLSTADYADYNAFVNAEASKWKQVEDDIRSKRMSIYSCLVAFNITFLSYRTSLVPRSKYFHS